MGAIESVEAALAEVGTDIGTLQTAGIGKNHLLSLDGDTDHFLEVTIVDDGTAASGWPERLVFWYDDDSATPRRVFYLNEYGECRISPANASTIPFRVFTRETTSDPAHNNGVPVIQVMDDRNNTNQLFAVHNDGTIESPTIDTLTTPTVTAATGTSRNLALADQNAVITRSNASASTETIPLNSGTALPVGFRYTLVNIGAGVVTITPTGGVTLRAPRGLLVRQYEAAQLVKIATDTWEVLAHGSGGVVAWPTGSEPSLTGIPDGTLWVEYTP